MRFTSPNIAAGFVRYLRKAGCPRLGLLLYKLVVTADAPVGLAAKGLQYLRRKLHGRHERAAHSWLALKGQWEFLTKGLRAFWRA